VISRLQVQGSIDGVACVELMVLEQELARFHYRVGRLMIFSLQAAEYQDAETHFKQALHLYRKVEASRGTLHGAAARAAAGKLADKAAPEGLYGVIIDLGQLYGCMRKDYDELQVYQEALDEVRVDIAHASSPQLQGHLSNGLAAMGQMYIRQYYSQITNGAKEDKGKCTVAIALCEEALSIQRALSQDGITADTLTTLASAHGCLEMFDGARSALKEALNLSSCSDKAAPEGLYGVIIQANKNFYFLSRLLETGFRPLRDSERPSGDRKGDIPRFRNLALGGASWYWCV